MTAPQHKTAPAHREARDFAMGIQQVGYRLDQALAMVAAMPRNEVRRSIEDGAVYLNGARCLLAAHRVALDDAVRMLPRSPDRTGIDTGQLRIVHQDEWLMVVDKPAGLPTQPPPRGGDALSLRVRRHLGEDVYLGELHRLDRDVSGLVVYALRPDAAAHVAEQLRTHAARRLYVALVRTAIPIPAQTVNEPLQELAPGVMGMHPTGVPARTHLIPLDFDVDAQVALVGVRLETGRSHQIRVHLAWTAGALLGDKLYGDLQDGPRVGLHATALRVVHPGDGVAMQWLSPPPPDFWALAADAQLTVPEDWPPQERTGAGGGTTTTGGPHG